ncbi:MAG: FAD:protein FMN transferase [Lachnospiraceae bacterium]|nr:FAD:protein FMN transferase [Lachnospiraceae bacterium]
MKHSIALNFKLLLLLIASLILQGCGSSLPAKRYITRSAFCFDTYVQINIYDSMDEDLLEDCIDMCYYYEDLLSATVKGSDIYMINKAGTKPVTVSSDTIYLLKEAQVYRDISDGLLDISMAPLTDRWTRAREDKEVPEKDEIIPLLDHVGLDNIIIDEAASTVRKEDPEASIDLGALGKGFIADKIKEMLVSKGVGSAVISLGGNILTIGNRRDGSPFHIGVKEPFARDTVISCSLNVSDKSVVTSGIYERYFEKDGVIYHHILDPRNGFPADTDLYSATIISDSSLEGDALSTVCLLWGLDRSMELINKTPGVEAVFITEDNKLHYTGGASSIIEMPIMTDE